MRVVLSKKELEFFVRIVYLSFVVSMLLLTVIGSIFFLAALTVLNVLSIGQAHVIIQALPSPQFIEGLWVGGFLMIVFWTFPRKPRVRL
jgi:hypothetical protein